MCWHEMNSSGRQIWSFLCRRTSVRGHSGVDSVRKLADLWRIKWTSLKKKKRVRVSQRGHNEYFRMLHSYKSWYNKSGIIKVKMALGKYCVRYQRFEDFCAYKFQNTFFCVLRYNIWSLNYLKIGLIVRQQSRALQR